jgi:hypothetical protein
VWGAAESAEVAALRDAGAGVTVVTADAAAEAAMGPDPMSDLGAALAVECGRSTGRRALPD